MNAREILPGVHGLGSEQVNWYLIEDGGAYTAVDAGLPGFAKTLDHELSALGIDATKITAVVLTHSDGDHTGLAPVLRERGARVLIHEADDASLRKPAPKGGDASVPKVLGNLWRPSALRVLGHQLRHGGAKLPKIEGAETFSGGDVLDVPGGLQAIHTPGHTAGHCALLAPGRRVLFAGDALIDHPLVTKGRGPQVMPRYTNIDTEQAVRSLDALDDIDADVVLFGHGDPWHDGVAKALASARR